MQVFYLHPFRVPYACNMCIACGGKFHLNINVCQKRDMMNRSNGFYVGIPYSKYRHLKDV
jgi:hypothetical protein